MNPALQGYTAAVVASAGTDALAGLAGDLEDIDRFVQTNDAMRGLLTDTTLRGPVRRAVMLDLLEGKVSEPARRLAAFACAAVGAPDVPAAVSWLANRTRHLADGYGNEEMPLGLLQSRQRIGGFATALHEDDSTAELESMEDELFRFARIVQSTPGLRGALVDRDLSVEARQALATQLLEGKVLPGTLDLVRYVVAGGRARDIVGSLDWLVEQTAKARGWRIARVRAAAPVEDAQRSGLSETLATLTGSPVELQVVIDPSLLSGAVIEIGDLQVDATARGRLNALREHLVPGGWDDKLSGGADRPRGTTTEGAV